MSETIDIQHKRTNHCSALGRDGLLHTFGGRQWENYEFEVFFSQDVRQDLRKKSLTPLTTEGAVSVSGAQCLSTDEFFFVVGGTPNSELPDNSEWSGLQVYDFRNKKWLQITSNPTITLMSILRHRNHHVAAWIPKIDGQETSESQGDIFIAAGGDGSSSYVGKNDAYRIGVNPRWTSKGHIKSLANEVMPPLVNGALAVFNLPSKFFFIFGGRVLGEDMASRRIWQYNTEQSKFNVFSDAKLPDQFSHLQPGTKGIVTDDRKLKYLDLSRESPFVSVDLTVSNENKRSFFDRQQQYYPKQMHGNHDLLQPPNKILYRRHGSQERPPRGEGFAVSFWTGTDLGVISGGRSEHDTAYFNVFNVTSETWDGSNINALAHAIAHSLSFLSKADSSVNTESNPSLASPQSSSGPSKTLIIGTSVGSFLGIGVIILLVVFCFRRQKSKLAAFLSGSPSSMSSEKGLKKRIGSLGQQDEIWTWPSVAQSPDTPSSTTLTPQREPPRPPSDTLPVRKL